MDSVQLWLESMREGAAWLGVGMSLVLLAILGITAWVSLRTPREEAVLATPGLDLDVLQNAGGQACRPVTGEVVDNPDLQDEIRLLQGRLTRGEIDRATYAAALARLCKGEAA